jgi:hypothetical protein
MMPKTKILQEPGKEVPTAVLAKSIEEIATGVRKIRSAGLNDRAIEVLLRDSSGVGIAEIQKVLSALENLDKRYLKSKNAKVNISDL